MNSEEPLYGAAVPAAQVQDRDRAPGRQLGRRADPGRRPRAGARADGARRRALGSLLRRRPRAVRTTMPQTAPLLGLHLGRIARDQVVDAVQGDRHAPEGARRAPRSQAGALEVHDPAARRRSREAGAARALRHRARGRRAAADRAGAAAPRLRHDALDGTSCYGISVENGRMKPPLRKAIRAAVEALDLGVRLTPHQDVLLCDVRDRAALLAILDAHGVARPEAVSRARSLAMACPAKPTCGLAMTDAENILPRYFDAIEAAGLGDVDVEIRMTGCPNNCARPPTRRDRHLRLRQERPRDPGRAAHGDGTRIAQVALRAHLGRADGAGAGRPVPRRQGALPGRHAPRRLDRRHRLLPTPHLDRPRPA